MTIASEKRRHCRRVVIDIIDFFLDPLTNDDILDGVMVDISQEGFCLLTKNHLSKGQTIIIQNGISEPIKSAMVRWSKRYNDLYSKSGLEFV